MTKESCETKITPSSREKNTQKPPAAAAAPKKPPQRRQKRNFPKNPPAPPKTGDEAAIGSTLCKSIVSQLNRNTYTCAICLEKMQRKQPPRKTAPLCIKDFETPANDAASKNPNHQSARKADFFWHCAESCFGIFHWACVEKWWRGATTAAARDALFAAAATFSLTSRTPSPNSASAEGCKWKCPQCAHVYAHPPTKMACFCSAASSPKAADEDEPRFAKRRTNAQLFSCTRICGRRLATTEASGDVCLHTCPQPCHPGACAPCVQTVQVRCHCGAQCFWRVCGGGGSQTATRNSPETLSCGAPCNKLRSCGVHRCEAPCHAGDCAPCPVVSSVPVACRCGRQKRHLPCPSLPPSGSDAAECRVSCGVACGKLFACGKHACAEVCHEPPLPSRDCSSEPCPRQRRTRCFCGRQALGDAQRAALQLDCEFVPQGCGEVCGKTMACGHACIDACHASANCDVQRCTRPVEQRCACKAAFRTVACNTAALSPFACAAVCGRLRACGVHRCFKRCCPASGGQQSGHECTLPCGKRLTCGVHRCEAACHAGKCAPCPRISFRERTCHCGASVTLPPIFCDTPATECRAPCARETHCAVHFERHPHACHPDDEPCPLCPALVRIPCFCGRSRFKSVACGVLARSDAAAASYGCGRRCGRRLSASGCGHVCERLCHAGACIPTPTAAPSQPGDAPIGGCPAPCVRSGDWRRPACGHACGERCHFGVSCAEAAAPLCRVLVSLQCGCGARSQSAPCHEAQELLGLECTEACFDEFRAQRFAASLCIAVDEAGCRIVAQPAAASSFSAFLLENRDQWLSLCVRLERMFVGLLHATRTHHRALHLPPMCAAKRRFVQEYADVWRFSHEVVDRAPVKSVIVWHTTSDSPAAPVSLLSAVDVAAEQARNNAAAERSAAAAASQPEVAAVLLATDAQVNGFVVRFTEQPSPNERLFGGDAVLGFMTDTLVLAANSDFVSRRTTDTLIVCFSPFCPVKRFKLCTKKIAAFVRSNIFGAFFTLQRVEDLPFDGVSFGDVQNASSTFSNEVSFDQDADAYAE